MAMMEAARTSETSVDNYFTRQYIPEDKSELDSLKFLIKSYICTHDCFSEPLVLVRE
jgi:hypothetical protein